MNKGMLIKLNRHKQNMSQKELADGIVSVSYLSRIENHHVEPHEDVYKLLLDKLNINRDEQTDHTDYAIDLMEQWEICLLRNKRENSENIFNKLVTTMHHVSDPFINISFYINQIRYYIITGEMKSIPEIIQIIEAVFSELPNKLKFYYLKHAGNYYQLTYKTELAEEKHYNAIQLIPLYQSITEEEIADVYYLYSLSLSNNRKDANAIYYAELALDIYKDNYRVKPWACCHILLGICYRKI